jgi:hypothetical protein
MSRADPRINCLVNSKTGETVAEYNKNSTKSDSYTIYNLALSQSYVIPLKKGVEPEKRIGLSSVVASRKPQGGIARWTNLKLGSS